MEELIEISGGIAIVFLVIAFFLGFNNWKLHWFRTPISWHVWTAIIALLAGIAHVIAVAGD